MAADPRNPNTYFILDGTNFALWNSETKTLRQLLQSIGGVSVGDSYLILWDLQSSLAHKTSLDSTQAHPYATTSLSAITQNTIEEILDHLLIRNGKNLWLFPNSGHAPILLTDTAEARAYTHTAAYVLWWDKKTISIYWTVENEALPSFQETRKELLYESPGVIRQVQPYPLEHDIIFQENNGIYTLELDGRGGTRNKHILYKGVDPSFYAPPQEKILYVLDEGSLFTIELP